MMSRITLALKKHLVDLGSTAHHRGRSNPLEWGAVTRPARIPLSRGRVQYVQRAPCDTGLLSVVSHVAGRKDVNGTVAIVGCEENEESIEMVDMCDSDKARTPLSGLSV